MPFEEKVTWVSAVVSVFVSAVYFSVVGGQLDSGPVSEIAYQRWMLIAVVATIAMTIVGSIMAGIGTGISAEITGKGSVDDIGLKDERDEHINRRFVLQELAFRDEKVHGQARSFVPGSGLDQFIELPGIDWPFQLLRDDKVASEARLLVEARKRREKVRLFRFFGRQARAAQFDPVLEALNCLRRAD